MRFKGLTLAYLAKLLREKMMINVPEREEGAAVKKLYNKRNFEKIKNISLRI
jgi:hypothetical protein